MNEEDVVYGLVKSSMKLLLVLSLLVGVSRENVGWIPFSIFNILLLQLDWNSFKSNRKDLEGDSGWITEWSKTSEATLGKPLASDSEDLSTFSR